jgi:hypothetical protein
MLFIGVPGVSVSRRQQATSGENNTIPPLPLAMAQIYCSSLNTLCACVPNHLQRHIVFEKIGINISFGDVYSNRLKTTY